MKSIYNGKGIANTRYHVVQYFDGQKLREVSVITHDGVIIWVESNHPEMLNTGNVYRKALRKIARYEKLCTRR